MINSKELISLTHADLQRRCCFQRSRKLLAKNTGIVPYIKKFVHKIFVHAHFTVVLINCSYSLLRNIFTIGQPQFDVANV